MTSNNRFFTTTTRPVVQGRTVNLGGSMIKRTPIFTVQPEASPFMNYGWRSGESFLSESQVSTLQQKINPENIRQLIKEQFSRLPSTEEASRKQFQTVQAQFTDLKDRIAEYENISHQRLQESVARLKEEMKLELREQLQLQLKEQSERMQKDVQSDLSSKLRIFFQKANIELKKDILEAVGEQFLPFDYGQDLQNRLSLVNQKLQRLDHLLESKDTHSVAQVQQKDRFQLTQNIEATLLKLEKQYENHKKIVQEFTNRLRQTEDNINHITARQTSAQNDQRIKFLQEKLKQTENQYTAIIKRIITVEGKQAGVEGDLKMFKTKVSDNTQVSEQLKQLMLNLTKQIASNESAIEQIKKTRKISLNPATIEIVGRNGRTSASPPSLKPYQQNAQERQSTSNQKARYQVDRDGYLMDGDGKYLLTETNQMVWLNDEQINILMTSQQVEIVDS